MMMMFMTIFAGDESADDDDVYYYIRWRLKLEGETENMGVCTKERKGVTAEVLRATPCPMPLQPATCTTQQSLLAFTPDSVVVVVASDNDEHDRLCHYLPPPALPRPYSSF